MLCPNHTHFTAFPFLTEKYTSRTSTLVIVAKVEVQSSLWRNILKKEKILKVLPGLLLAFFFYPTISFSQPETGKHGRKPGKKRTIAAVKPTEEAAKEPSKTVVAPKPPTRSHRNEPKVATQPAKKANKVNIEVLLRKLHSAHLSERQEASQAFAKLGKPGIPVLVRTVKSSSYRSRYAAALALVLMGKLATPTIIGLMGDRRFYSWYVFQSALRKVKKQNKNAGDFLLQALLKATNGKSHKAQERALLSLGLLSPATAKTSLPILLKALNHKRTSVKRAAVIALGNLGGHAKNAIPALMAELKKSQRTYFRSSVAKSLHQIGGLSKTQIGELQALYTKTKSQWLRSLLLLPLSLGGSTTMPLLLKALESKHWSTRVNASKGFKNIGKVALPALVKKAHHPNPKVQRAVLSAMSHIGKEAVPHLLKLYQTGDDVLRGKLIRSIGALKEHAIPILKKGIADDDRRVQLQSVRALRYRGKYSIPLLLEAVKKAPLKKEAFYAMSQLQQADPKMLPILLSGLKDKDHYVRIYAVRTLKHFKKLPKNALQVLTKMRKHKNGQMRAAAYRILLRNKDRALPLLKDVLHDSSWSVRYAARGAIRNLGAAALPTLSKLYPTTKGRIRINVLRSIGEITQTPHPILIQALKDKNHRIIRTAINGLKGKGPDVLKAVLPLLKHPSSNIRRSVIYLLGSIGKKSTSYLIEALKDKNSWNQVVAFKQLRRIDAAPHTLLPVALKKLQSKNYSLRSEAIRTLQGMGKQVVPAMFELLKDTNVNKRASAIEILGRLRLNPQQLLPILRKALSDSSDKVKIAAIKTTQQTNGAPKALKKELIQLLGHQNSVVRRSLLSALGRISKQDPKLLPHLLKAAQDKDYFVRQNAYRLLKKFGQKVHGILLKRYSQASDAERLAILQAFSFIGKPPFNVQIAVIDGLTSSKHKHQDAALGVVERFRSVRTANTSNALLVLFQKTRSPRIQTRIIQVFRKKGLSSAKLLPLLHKLVKAENEGLRRSIISALGELGANDYLSVRSLLSALSDTDHSIRESAFFSLRKSKVPIQYTISALIVNLQSPSFAVQLFSIKALETLSTMSLFSKHARAGITLALQHSDPSVRFQALKAFQLYAASSSQSERKLLFARLSDDKRWNRIEAAKTIARIGASAIPLLVQVIHKNTVKSRPYAALALGLLGKKAKQAIATLQNAAKSSDADLAFYSQQALKLIQKK